MLIYLSYLTQNISSDYNGSKFYLPYNGLLINKNTIEEFKECDKKNIIKEAGDILENDIKTGRALKNPTLLNLFIILSYAVLE